MKTTKIFLLILLLGLILFSLTNCERFRRLPPEQRLDKIVEFLNKELNLREDQYQNLIMIKEEIKKKYKENKKLPFFLEEKYIQQLENNSLNKEEIKNQIKEFHNSMLESRLYEFDKVFPFLQSLDESQRKKLADLIRKHREHMEKHFYRKK